MEELRADIYAIVLDDPRRASRGQRVTDEVLFTELKILRDIDMNTVAGYNFENDSERLLSEKLYQHLYKGKEASSFDDIDFLPSRGTTLQNIYGTSKKVFSARSYRTYMDSQQLNSTKEKDASYVLLNEKVVYNPRVPAAKRVKGMFFLCGGFSIILLYFSDQKASNASLDSDEKPVSSIIQHVVDSNVPGTLESSQKAADIKSVANAETPKEEEEVMKFKEIKMEPIDDDCQIIGEYSAKGGTGTLTHDPAIYSFLERIRAVIPDFEEYVHEEMIGNPTTLLNLMNAFDIHPGGGVAGNDKLSEFMPPASANDDENGLDESIERTDTPAAEDDDLQSETDTVESEADTVETYHDLGDKQKDVVTLATRIVQRMKRDWMALG
uniref:Uncharacterized protein n=1 Tax=Panagrolaimus sp. ES5 TaxID=591445 RepID=A0AC34FM89_9BILA